MLDSDLYCSASAGGFLKCIYPNGHKGEHYFSDGDIVDEVTNLRSRLAKAEADSRRRLQEIRAEVIAIWERVDRGQREGALARVGVAMTLIDAAIAESSGKEQG